VERFEMASSLAGDCQQVIVGQSIGAAQNRPYHIDGFIARQPALLFGRSRYEGPFNFRDKRSLFNHNVSRPGELDGLSLAADHYHRVRRNPCIRGNVFSTWLQISQRNPTNHG
jgi:hypothetical protein